MATGRFPHPEFETGYTLPDTQVTPAASPWWDAVDVALLAAALIAASVLVRRARSRRGLWGLTAACVAYFGFIREGCICPVGSLQNVALAIADSTAALPLAVAAFFLLPIAVALVAGRTFCAAVCPLGAIQELVLLWPLRVPPWLDRPLRLLAWLYLGAAVLFATTDTLFVICRYDPFVSFFRLDGSTARLVLGVSFLAVGLFVARPYCRWLCPYGVLLGVASRLSAWPVRITDGCTRCNQCVGACPYGAIDAAGPARKVEAAEGRPRLQAIAMGLVIGLGVTGWMLGVGLAPSLAKLHPDVDLAGQLLDQRTGEPAEPTDEIRGHWRTGEPEAAVFARAVVVQQRFGRRAPQVGAVLGVLLALHLWLRGRRRVLADCEPDRGDCLACGRCWTACPEEPTAGRGPLLADPTQRRAAGITAVIAGAVTLGVALVLALAPLGGASPTGDEELAAMKARLLENPGDEQLPQAIRDHDVTLRQAWFGRRDRTRTGRLVLLIAAVVTLGAAQLAWPYQRPPPPPAPRTRKTWLRDHRRGVTAIGIAGGLVVVLASAAVLLMSRGWEDPVAEYAALAQPEQRLETATAAPPPPWPGFRGPGGRGLADGGPYPTAWDGASGEGIAWRAEIPLPGKGSPLLTEELVLLTGATEEERAVLAYDRDDGALRWRVAVDAAYRPNPEDHFTTTNTGHAASTPATDGERVYAIFSNGDLAAVDLDGSLAWVMNVGAPDSAYGHAASLVVHGDLLLVQLDQGLAGEDLSELLALHTDTGRVAWRVKRPVASSWTTPTVIQHGGRSELITAADPWVIAYAPDSGEELWRAGGLRGEIAPSPLLAGGLVLAVSPYERVVAVRPGGSGDVTEGNVAWKVTGDFPDLASPVSDGQRVYLLTRDGRLTALALDDGRTVGEVRLPGDYSASPALAGGVLYCLSESGAMTLVDPGDEPRVLGSAGLGEAAWASPAFDAGRIYLRGEHHLWCVTGTEAKP